MMEINLPTNQERHKKSETAAETATERRIYMCCVSFRQTVFGEPMNYKLQKKRHMPQLDAFLSRLQQWSQTKHQFTG